MSLKYEIPFDLDDPNATLAHRDIILQKPFLKKIYCQWYADFEKTIHTVNKGIFLEIGSGGGFLKDVLPQVVTSDILPLPCVDKVLNAESMPYADDELGCVMMLNVFHHIPKPYLFLSEAQRTLIKGGKIIMTEPANSTFGRFIYKRFHHEPFDPSGKREISSGNPLSNSNQALPFIYFERDIVIFKKDFPRLKINFIKYHTPLLYILSGGVSRKPLVPYFTYPFFKFVEIMLSPFSKYLGLFCTIEIEKID
jgi:SAM-dependent methyltransferase